MFSPGSFIVVFSLMASFLIASSIIFLFKPLNSPMYCLSPLAPVIASEDRSLFFLSRAFASRYDSVAPHAS